VIKAVIFDFGRVISAQRPMAFFRRHERELGLAPGVLNRVMYGSEAWKEVLVGRKDLNEYWLEIGPELGLQTQQEIDAFRQRLFADEEINQDVLRLIRQLQGQYKLAVLSNAPPGLTRWMADWDILHLFDVVVCSGDEGVVKPDPAIYELTLSRLDVEPQEAIFIDDTLGHVEAARKLGLHGIHFTTASDLAAELEALLG
jgi:epoxide hydrolase-like predicted phosphatase